MYIEKNCITHYKNNYRISSPRLMTPFMNKHEYFNVSYKEEATACIPIQYLSKWDDYSSLFFHQHLNFMTMNKAHASQIHTTLAAQFIIEDYDKVKDYHLYIHDILCSMAIYIDDQMVTFIEPDNTYHRIDITHFVFEGVHKIKMVFFQDQHDVTRQSSESLLEDIYIVARAYDRIEDFDIYCQYDAETAMLLPTLNIKDIEGAPNITYSILDQFGYVLSDGEIDIDQPNRLNLNAIDLDDNDLHHFTLMLETQDEVIMHELMMKFVVPTMQACQPTKVFTL